MSAVIIVEHHVHLIAASPARTVQAGQQIGGQLRASDIGDQLGAAIAVQTGPAVGGGTEPHPRPPANGVAVPDRFSCSIPLVITQSR